MTANKHLFLPLVVIWCPILPPPAADLRHIVGELALLPLLRLASLGGGSSNFMAGEIRAGEAGSVLYLPLINRGD